MKGVKSLKAQRPPHMERIYVKVNSDFDATGYMQPRSITWADGRTFKIDAIKDYRPAACYRQGAEGLPPSDVLALTTARGRVIVRPSGTEPKLKLYFSARGGCMDDARQLCAALQGDMAAYVK